MQQLALRISLQEIATVMVSDFSDECLETLKLLARSKNVLVSGAPGTGKSRLLAEVALAFETGLGVSSSHGTPALERSNPIPIPPSPGKVMEGVPAPYKTNRMVFRTVFHQNSKYRDFVSGVLPCVNNVESGSGFYIVKGVLYRASEHANSSNSASLLIIDEINRGPAVQVFGGSLVAIESDKRLAPDGSKLVGTQYFELLDPLSGEFIEYALPSDLYILAAMNQADASVEPLDVAFLRRWEPLKLEPNERALRDFYNIKRDDSYALPAEPSSISDVFEASVLAWISINEQVSLGRGSEFRIGHGILMTHELPEDLDVFEALEFICVGWTKIFAHVEEVFFGDIRGLASTLNAIDGPEYNPFELVETTFASEIRFKLEGPSRFDASMIYDALRAFSRDE
ncbi:AAA family ATPase [Shewanella sp. Isolate8]|uniref:AAA family ATPase n=1 Tax=Shewanella sp. Isolate8 TaxID=2908529 RepID=UPI001EFD78EB|nr:AAA family ATPase [Shewanella sp. Isolate8]MCG9745046.1 AAA family ATPase [Shewanella sp. Isolate8]